MNQSKLKYARERLRSITRDKVNAADSYEAEPDLEIADALKRLRNGTASVNWSAIGTARDRWGHTLSIINDIERQVIGKDNAAITKRNSKLRRTSEAVATKIHAAALKVEDELVLGDEAKAMALLNAFANS